MSAYCSIANVYEWVPRGSVSAQPLLVAAVDASANVLTIDGHGFALDDEITFRVEAGGSMPSPLVAGTTYYAIPVTSSTFQVATSAGGSAVNLTTVGENVVAVVPPPWARWIAAASGELEDVLRAHLVPLSAPYPEVVVSYTAGVTAGKALRWCGTKTDQLDADLQRVRLQLKDWCSKAIPLRGTNAPISANRAVRAAVVNTDPNGWCNPLGSRYIP